MIPKQPHHILLVVFALSMMTVTLPVTAQIVTNEDGGIVWPEFEQAVERSGESGKILMVDIWSATCGWCRKQQTEVYTRPELQQLLAEHFEIGRIVIDRTTDTLSFRGFELSSAELAAGLGASGTPTTVFLEPSGAYITRLAGFHAYEDFMDVLAFIGTESFRSMGFQEFVDVTSREEEITGSN